MNDPSPIPAPEPGEIIPPPVSAEWKAKYEAAGSAAANAPGTVPALPGGWATYTDFVQWSWKNPESVRHWNDFMDRLDGGEKLDLSPEMQAKVVQYRAFRKQARAMEAARVKNQELIRFLRAPAPDGDMDEKTR